MSYFVILMSRSTILAALFAVLALTTSGAEVNPDVTWKITNPKLPKVVVVTTGGTIAERVNDNTGGAVPSISGDKLVAAVPALKDVANIGVCQFSNIDSSQMTPELWANLSRAVDAILVRPDVVGVVVTHGTDTMAEGAYFLELTLKSDKPVVFTGAMKNASSPAPDGPGNLLDAVVQVCSANARDWGVTVTLNAFVNGARAARKTDTTNPQTFMSGDKGYLGYIAEGKVVRLNVVLIRQKLPIPETLPKVVFLSTYSGADGSLVRFAVDSGADGIVIDGVGAGNVDARTFEAIKYALAKNVPVVISSRVYHGTVAPIYADAGGGKTLQKTGCILAGDLLGQKARLLLMLGLGEYHDDSKALRKLFDPRSST